MADESNGNGAHPADADARLPERRTRVALRRLSRVLEARTRRIAQELHDESSSLLSAVFLALDDLSRDVPTAQRERLASIRRMLEEVQEQLRGISHELRPALLDDFGLMPSLESLCHGVAARTGLAIAIDGTIDERLPAEVETTIYRTVQEALANAAKHSRAVHVSVRLKRRASHVVCSIRDDGRGLASREEGGPHVRGMGLIGLRARLAAVRGRLHIDSEQGLGTRLTVLVPVGRPRVA